MYKLLDGKEAVVDFDFHFGAFDNDNVSGQSLSTTISFYMFVDDLNKLNSQEVYLNIVKRITVEGLSNLLSIIKKPEGYESYVRAEIDELDGFSLEDLKRVRAEGFIDLTYPIGKFEGRSPIELILFKKQINDVLEDLKHKITCKLEEDLDEDID